MSVEPLFVVDMPTLRKRLRLGGVEVNSNASDMIDQAVEDVRIGLFNPDTGLGEARVVTLRAVVFVENALTTAALERTRANSLEVSWVRLLLLRRMTIMFQDGSVPTFDLWNNEPITRLSMRDLQKEIDRLQEEISSELEDLGTGIAPGGIDVLVLEPKDAPFKPGSSIVPVILTGD